MASRAQNRLWFKGSRPGRQEVINSGRVLGVLYYKVGVKV